MASKFTQRHYEDIAQTLFLCKPQGERIISQFVDGAEDMHKGITEHLVMLFTDDNPRFNADKFRTAVRDGVKNYYARR